MSEIQNLLLEKINSNSQLIEDWFKSKFAENPAVFYNSVDLRHSGFKIAPIDNNCFPAGFNNLCVDAQSKAHNVVEDYLIKNHPDARKILIIPENHTRNLKYLQNVKALKSIVEIKGRNVVEIGSLIDDIDGKMEIELENSDKIILHKIVKKNNRIVTESGFDADIIIINNDFTNAPGDILENIEQKLMPSTSIGWFNRMKSVHFDIYENLAKELSEIIKIDHWFIDPVHRNCKNIDFKNKVNIQELADLTQDVLSEIRSKYKQHNIDKEAYCYIKADNGTYGMAMMTIKDSAEILNINKKQRNKMNMIKGNIVNSQVIIQEGIPTADKINDMIAEPMIYLFNGVTVGNLSRINNERDQNISLNAAGMQFRDISTIADKDLDIGGKKDDIFKIYSLIARLSALAAACEKYNKS